MDQSFSADQVHEILTHVGRGWSRIDAALVARDHGLVTQAEVLETNLPYCVYGTSLLLTSKKRQYPAPHLPSVAVEYRRARIKDKALLCGREIEEYTFYKAMPLLFGPGWEQVGACPIPSVWSAVGAALRANTGVLALTSHEADWLGIGLQYPAPYLSRTIAHTDEQWAAAIERSARRE